MKKELDERWYIVEKYQKIISTCNDRKTCTQHPLVCLICNRRMDLEDRYKKYL